MSIWTKKLNDAIARGDAAAYRALMNGEHMYEVEVDAGSPAALTHYLNKGDIESVKSWQRGELDKKGKIIIQQKPR